MKKLIILLLFSLILFGIMLNAVNVFADDDNDNSGRSDNSGSSENSNSNLNSNSNSVSSGSDNNRNNNREGNNEERGSRKADGMREFADEDRRVVKERRIETFVDSRGNNITVLIITETRTRDNQTIQKIKVRQIEIESEVELEEENETEIEDGRIKNITKIKARLSNGNFTRIKILPDRASEIAKQILNATNYTITLKETKHKNIPRVVYLIQENKNGKFLGIFKFAMKVEGQIDPETGEVISISRPWWAFLVKEYVDSQNPPANETNNNQTNGNNTTPGNNTLPGNETIPGNETLPGNESVGNDTVINETNSSG